MADKYVQENDFEIITMIVLHYAKYTENEATVLVCKKQVWMHLMFLAFPRTILQPSRFHDLSYISP